MLVKNSIKESTERFMHIFLLLWTESIALCKIPIEEKN